MINRSYTYSSHNHEVCVWQRISFLSHLLPFASTPALPVCVATCGPTDIMYHTIDIVMDCLLDILD